MRGVLKQFGWIGAISIVAAGLYAVLAPAGMKVPMEVPSLVGRVEGAQGVPSEGGGHPVVTEGPIRGPVGGPVSEPSEASRATRQVPPHPKPVTAVLPPPSYTPGVHLVELEAVLRAYQAGWPFLDARRAEVYRSGHIRGAFSVPVWEGDVRGRIRTVRQSLGTRSDSPMVVYCAGGGCEDAELLAAYLVQEGVKVVLVFDGGFPAWQAAGKPVVLGDEP